MKLSEKVREFRTSHGYSQRAFAEKCGVSHSYISILEKGMNPNTNEPLVPTLPILKKVALAMSTTVDELLQEIDDMPISMSAEIPVEAVPISMDQVKEWSLSASKEEKAEVMTAILQSSPVEDAKELLKIYLDLLMGK